MPPKAQPAEPHRAGGAARPSAEHLPNVAAEADLHEAQAPATSTVSACGPGLLDHGGLADIEGDGALSGDQQPVAVEQHRPIAHGGEHGVLEVGLHGRSRRPACPRRPRW